MKMNMMTALLLPLVLAAGCTANGVGAQGAKTAGLKTNHLFEPGHVSGVPTFSWLMKSERPGAAQKAYRIRVTEGAAQTPVWDSGEVACGKSVGIVYGGAPLKSAMKYDWTVSVKDETGVWRKPASASFGTGLLEKGDWDGTMWISAAQKRGTNVTTAAFCRTVKNAKPVVEAWLTVSGLGVFEAFVNGARITEDVFLPGFTHQYKCHHAFTYDVTELMKRGAGDANVLSAFSSRGWWLGGDDPSGYRLDRSSAFRAQLILRHADGTETRVGTDASWMAKYTGPVLDSQIYAGETFDARISTSWMKDGKLDGTWLPVVENKDRKGEIRPFTGSPIRIRRDLAMKPVRAFVTKGVTGVSSDAFGTAVIVRDCKPGETIALDAGEELVLDFAQNSAGYPEITVEGKAGTALTLRHGEWMNEGNGEKSRGCDGPGNTLFVRNLRRAYQRDVYTMKDGCQTYHPVFTWHGYRFMSIRTTAPVTIRSIVSLPVSSICDARYEESSLVTDRPELNRLVQNVCWTTRSNFFSVPTDCPQRCERLGWAADPMIVQKASTYQANVYAFYSKWMTDIVDTQGTNGCFAALGPLGKYSDPTDKGGWSDAGIVVPYRLWQQYGDLAVVRDNWDAMRTHMEFVNRTRYETFYGRQWQWADWLSFEKLESCALGGGTGGWGKPTPDHNIYWDYLNQCWWLRDAVLMEKMARVLGKDAEAVRYAQMAADARAYLRKKYFTGDGVLIPLFDDMQTPRLFALKLKLYESDAGFQRLREELFANIDKNGGCLRTGLHGTSMILETITRDAAAPERAYSLLLQRNFPSWLFCVDQGATTIWERWDGYTKKGGFATYGMNSYNHVAFGCVLAWMYDTMAGIREDPENPGFKHVVLAPVIDRRVGEVNAVHASPYGKIKSHWKYQPDGSWVWNFTIPANVTATVKLPGGETKDYAAGSYRVAIENP